MVIILRAVGLPVGPRASVVRDAPSSVLPCLVRDRKKRTRSDAMPEIILNHIQQPLQVNVWDLVSQVIESRRDPLDLVREQLSNMCAFEVGAKNVSITFYTDPEHG